MAAPSRWIRLLNYVLSIGSYPGESETQRGKRQIMVVAILLATLFTIPTVFSDLDAGYTISAIVQAAIIAMGFAALVALRLKPYRFLWIINTIFVVVFVTQLVVTALFGGLFGSALAIVFGLIIVLGALVVFSVRAAFWWLVAFLASVGYAVAIPNWVDPVYVRQDPVGDAAFNLAAFAVVVFAVMAYFVRQRDRFQKQSDDLLHNILPDEIADRLKGDETMIADSFESASVLFADVVDFTPMSAGMSPPELVGLLNSVFTTFDKFVDKLGLEKIKTVGDEYMVAAGVPRARADHADAIAELAIRIRDHVAANEFDGHKIALRIGINSGPVIAGIIGTNKFSYDLWGDVVNTASRMESEGVAGSVQVSPATYELVKGTFECEPRGVISVKGKGDMNTYFLLSRRADSSVTS